MSHDPHSAAEDGRQTGPSDQLRVARSLPRSAPPPQPQPTAPTTPLYQRVGGEQFFVDLVDAFYRRVAEDHVLRPLYPEQDLGPANERLRLFLIQYWGGPTTYSDRRGHPRLRMRHAPFPVGSSQIEAWLVNMRAALDEVDPPASEAEELWAYFQRAAHFMRNVEG